MFMCDSTFFVLTLFLLLFCDTTSSECNQLSTCSCILPESETNKLVDQTAKGTSNLKGYTLYIDPCIKLPESENVCNATANVSLCAKLPIINEPISIGVVGKGKVILNPGYNKVSCLILHGNKTKKVDLNCCTTCSTEFISSSINNSTELHYISKLASPDLCKAKLQSDSLSTGSVLVILLFVFGGLYFIGGAVILKCLRGATGWEMLPNHEFWCDLPSLVRDGITFTFNCCKVDSYERI